MDSLGALAGTVRIHLLGLALHPEGSRCADGGSRTAAIGGSDIQALGATAIGTPPRLPCIEGLTWYVVAVHINQKVPPPHDCMLWV